MDTAPNAQPALKIAKDGVLILRLLAWLTFLLSLQPHQRPAIVSAIAAKFDLHQLFGISASDTICDLICVMFFSFFYGEGPGAREYLKNCDWKLKAQAPAVAVNRELRTVREVNQLCVVSKF